MPARCFLCGGVPKSVARMALTALGVVLWLGSAGPSNAEPIAQLITLHPGWNAVFLEVEPQSNEPADVFSASTFAPGSAINDLLSVWQWNPRTSTVEFVQNPGTLVPNEPQWMTYFPLDPAVSDLHAIFGEKPYLIHLGGSVDVTWTVTGEPTVPRIEWRPNSFNFVGFHLTPGGEPLFVDFFSTSLAHAGQEIYRLDNASGTWVKVTSPSVPMSRGEAFWIHTQGSSEFVGPVSVQLDQVGGLRYGTTLLEQDLRIRNQSALDKTVSLTVSSGATQLHYWAFDPGSGVADWMLMSGNPLSLDVPAGEIQRVRLGVKRANMAAGTDYGDNVLVTDGEGTRILLPVAVTGIAHAGLWTGSATIRKTSDAQSGNPASCSAATPTGSEFSFRLIVHVDEGGTARLLHEVVQLWQEGTWKPDPNDLGKLIPDEPGTFVLLANDALIPSYSGAALRDGQPVGRRISSPAFAFSAASGPSPWPFGGGAFALGSTLTLTLVTPADEPTNPFRHQFHPDHKIGRAVTREITLDFTDYDADGKRITGAPTLSWGSAEVGGIYKEAFDGLNRNRICAEGTFLLHRVSDIGVLTDAPPGGGP